MLNEKYILKLLEAYLNNKREISEFEFFKMFSWLSKQEQYEVINIMIKNNIEYVDEKQDEAKDLQNVEVLAPKTYLKDYRRYMSLTNEELCVMCQHGDNAALTALLEKNKRFVYKIAKEVSNKFKLSSLTAEDLYIEGNIGLMEAANRFDVETGTMFSTYSWHWIRQRITRAIMDTGYTVRIPVHIFEKIIKFNFYRKEYEQYGDSSLENFIKYLSKDDEFGLSYKKLHELAVLSEQYMNTSSLNAFVGENGDTELQEFIPDDASTVEDIISAITLKEDIKKVLSRLKERERQVIELRFGLIGDHPKTLDEIGKQFGVTRERIRQLESKALKKLKNKACKERLKDYLN